MSPFRWGVRGPRVLRLLAIMSATLLGLFQGTRADDVKLVESPTLSPDGARIVFEWRGDLWSVATRGGRARRVTSHEANESRPLFSPDGKQLAFVSNRTGSSQVYLMPVQGGEPTQLTFHTEGSTPLQWISNGERLLINAQRDHFWRHTDRLFTIGLEPRSGETLLFDAAAEAGRLSPDGTRVVFTREGTQWWRQGYRGSQVTQVWTYTFDHSGDETKGFTPIVQEEAAARDPLWLDDSTLLYVSERGGSFQLWKHDLATDVRTQLTQFETGVIMYPSISLDRSVVVFRHGFDLYRLALTDAEARPERIRIVVQGDDVVDPIVREVLTEASEAAFTDDALEIATIVGGNVWVMDTELREPKQVTRTTEPESEVLFSLDRKTLYFISESGEQCDIWQATRGDDTKPWWLNEQFELKQLTNDSAVEGGLKLSPDGKTLAFVKGRGELWLMPLGEGEPRRLIDSWNAPSYDWAPDSKWITYAIDDNDFNRDVFIVDVAGEREPYNISRHPDNESGPVWSPDGRIIAFTGRRDGEEVDIHFVYLTDEQNERTERDRRLEAAIEKFEKERGRGSASSPAEPAASTEPPASNPPAEPTVDPPPAPPAEPAAASEPNQEAGGRGRGERPAGETPAAKAVEIDFDDLFRRVRTVRIPNSYEGRLFWSPDSKQLAFSARIDGQEGIYVVKPDESLRPTLLTSTSGSSPRWIAKGDRILWLVSGTPSSFTVPQKRSESFGFSVRNEYDRREKFRCGFVLAWRTMRDNFYDGALNNQNWDEVRRRYETMAAESVDEQMLGTVINLMLGELNGSHLGFYPSGGRGERGNSWRETTRHLGVRFEAGFQGPGLRIRDVIEGSPAQLERSRLEAGEVILAINGVEVDPAMDLTRVLNGPSDEPLLLRVAAAEGTVREVRLQAYSFGQARAGLYDTWIRANERKVEELSNGRLGYLHIQAMNDSSFRLFEQQLYAVGAGRDGLVIDVRENGGGSTADHLLTALTQPVHAITVPRGGGEGYPQDRKIYASWHKPIIVLCNQNSFSNAEIFSHAVKTLGRGRVVGVTTAGGVISTGATQILDLGRLRLPFRGWFLVGDGEDMELNGAVPDALIWPAPTDWPQGVDEQLSTAVSMLLEDVEAWQALPRPTPRRAAERRQ
ncbi:MAG: PD40 domain-containing protein [Planctomycetales bacterium]|nr:PD40 domain-containing protein [Planctomycetales bacterium]